MTNGEKMQAVFPDIEMWGESKDTLDYSLGGMIHRVTKSWWIAEYKEPTIQERQAESDKFDAAFHDGYNNGYAQARFDYEQKSILDTPLRAEIQELPKWALEILDKYKAESEK